MKVTEDWVKATEEWIKAPEEWERVVIQQERMGEEWTKSLDEEIDALQRREDTTQGALSITYSECGRMFGVLLNRCDDTPIGIYNILSSAPMRYHPIKRPVTGTIWTHGQCIRFATLGAQSITIWEVGFTSKRPPAEVESLPTPEGFDPSKGFLFLPTASRLAFALENVVLVWDIRRSTLLLSSVMEPGDMTFSADGRFFACGGPNGEIYLWKEAPTGYILHRTFSTGLGGSPLLSPNGQSIVASSGVTFQLWRTTDSTTSDSSVSTQAFKYTEPFVVAFSPDESLAAAARLEGNNATVRDLKSGALRLIIDTNVKIQGLGVTESTAFVVGDGKIITWDLSSRGHVLDVRVNTNDSMQTVMLDRSASLEFRRMISASMSPEFNYVVVVGTTMRSGSALNIYNASTGKHIAGTTKIPGEPAWFTPDGHEVWFHDLTKGDTGWAIVKDRGSDAFELEHLDLTGDRPGGCPWRSSRGYNVGDRAWVFGPSGKRLLWLPHHWRSTDEMKRIWGGRFLGLLHLELPQAVILELLED